MNLYYDQPNHWKHFPIPEGTAVKYGGLHSRILEATFGGLGKLSASLTYSTGYLETKEVIFWLSLKLFDCMKILMMPILFV